MRKEFSLWLETTIRDRKDVVFLSGDLGFQAFEKVKEVAGERFINVGVAEQNMVNLAAGLASEGFLPICYSIAPFAVFRPLEQIRLNLALHQKKVIIVGNGGGYGYGIMGATHHALEDIGVLSTLLNFDCIIPPTNNLVSASANYCIEHLDGPAYLRLGFGNSPFIAPDTSFQSILSLAHGDLVTIVGMGPVLCNLTPELLGGRADVFAVLQMPNFHISGELRDSIIKTKKLLVIEEHVCHGGLAQALTYKLARLGVPFQLSHLCAVGYPEKRYGSQAYHQKQSGLDHEGIKRALKELIHE